MRVIQYEFDQQDYLAVVSRPPKRASGRGPTRQEFQAALGYLATWGIGEYAYVRVFLMSDGELHAGYWLTEAAATGDARCAFLLAAVWQPARGAYSFNS